jgi:hypothetical protein
MKISAEHFGFENNRWQRLVQFIQLENSYSKNRLAEVFRNNEGLVDFLEQAEFYQSYYIQQEAHLALLKHDLVSFGRLLEKEKFLDGAVIKQLQNTHCRLRREMEKLETDFHDMQRKFNNFVEANM